jgi:uncharacterized protein YecE (DUF72 family)
VTFYRLPRAEAVTRWVEETPAGFVFAVKVSRYLTHVKRPRETEQHLALLLERIEPLVRSSKLGSLLWQLPRTFHRDDERLAAAFAAFPAGLRNGVEFRHESWFAPDMMALLRERNVARDRRSARDPRLPDTRADGRLHLAPLPRGFPGRARQLLAVRVRRVGRSDPRLGSERRCVRVLNNDWEGFAIRNALALKEQLGFRLTARS